MSSAVADEPKVGNNQKLRPIASTLVVHSILAGIYLVIVLLAACLFAISETIGFWLMNGVVAFFTTNVATVVITLFVVGIVCWIISNKGEGFFGGPLMLAIGLAFVWLIGWVFWLVGRPAAWIGYPWQSWEAAGWTLLGCILLAPATSMAISVGRMIYRRYRREQDSRQPPKVEHPA